MPACKITEYTSRFLAGVEVEYAPGGNLPTVRARIVEPPFLFMKHVQTCVVRLDNGMMVPCQQLTVVHAPPASPPARLDDIDELWWIGSLRDEPGNDPPDEHAKGRFRHVVWIKHLAVAPPAFGYFVEVFLRDEWFATCPGDKSTWSATSDAALAKGRIVGARFVDSLIAKYGDDFHPETWRREKSEWAYDFAVLHQRRASA